MQNETAAAYCIKSERMPLSRCALLMIKICFQEYKNEKMKAPDFAKDYEEIQPEINVILLKPELPRILRRRNYL